MQTSRRAFLALIPATLAATAAASPNSPKAAPADFAHAGKRLRFQPFGQYDWLDLPSPILSLQSNDLGVLARCVDGDYQVMMVDDAPWLVRQVRA